MEELEFKAKIYGTTDKKKLVTGKNHLYEYGAINIRTPELAKHIGKYAKIKVKINDETNNKV